LVITNDEIDSIAKNVIIISLVIINPTIIIIICLIITKLNHRSTSRLINHLTSKLKFNSVYGNDETVGTIWECDSISTF